MKKLITKSAAILAAISIVMVGVVPALADTATNDTTGAGSLNQTTVTNTNNVKVVNVSDAYIQNTVKTTSNSGGNSASQNTMGGLVQTGDAQTQVNLINSANINTTVIDMGQDSGSNTAGSSITGADSLNYADIANSNSVYVRNDNTAVLKNDITADANTGGNAANQNTDGGGGKVQTGDAVAVVSLTNRANDSATGIYGLGNFGTNIVGNSITGYGSLNDASVVNTNVVDVRNVSDASVLNKVRATSTTGANSASQNTLGGLVQSGDALTDLALITDANIVTTNVEAGIPGFQATSGSSVTGAESTNLTDLINSNTIEVVNRNNKGSSEDASDYDGVKWGVVNTDIDEANTGGNGADQNTYPGSVASGIASIGKYIRVCLNDTLTSIGETL